MTFTPMPFQADDLKTLQQNNYTALLNMGTGSGKTAATLFAVKDSGASRTLVIAPEQTHESAWIPTADAVMGVEAKVIGNTGKYKKLAMFDFLLGQPGIYLVTPELFTRTDSSEWSGDFLAADESHKLSTPRSKGQRRLSAYMEALDGEPISRRFHHRLMLSGTALRNKFELAWGIGRFLWPELHARGEVADSNFYRWQADRMDYRTIYTSRRDRNGQPVTVKEFYGEKKPGSWVSEAPCVITHHKREECCVHHPEGYLSTTEPTVSREVITLAPAQKKAIREMESMMMTYLEENPLVAEIPLTAAQRIRQMTLGVPTVTEEDEKPVVSFAPDCVSPFYNRLEEFLKDEAPDENVVVFMDSQKFASVVTERLNKAGIPAFEFSGATRKERSEKARGFGTEYRVVVGVIAAIAEGLDGLQRNASTEVWLSSSLDETLNEQARGRLDRTGQAKQVVRLEIVDDLGLAEGRYSEALEKRKALNQSLRKAQ